MTTTREAFQHHVNSLLNRALGGDDYATKSLACMALIVEGFPPEPDGDGEPAPNVIFMNAWKMAKSKHPRTEGDAAVPQELPAAAMNILTGGAGAWA